MQTHTGPNCIEHLKFSNPRAIRTLCLGSEPSTSYAYVRNFDNLEFLEWNQLEEFHLSMIMEYALGKRGKLKHLYCNLDRIESLSQSFDPQRLRILKNLYNLLKIEKVDELDVCFNGVQLSLKEFEFNDYEFERTPIEFHHHNVVQNELALVALRSVSHVDYLQLLDKHFDPESDRKAPPSNGLQINLQAFAKTYPCVRVVTLDNTTDQRRIDEESFIHFLSACEGLISLHLKCCEFKYTFYNRLAQVNSVKTLDHLSLFEANQFLYPINMHFLNSLPYLQHLQTNLAAKRTMLRLIASMAIGAEFMFGFWAPAGQTNYYWCFVRKLDRIDRWHLLIERGDYEDRNFREELHNGTRSLGELVDYFNSEENESITDHWLSNGSSEVEDFISELD